MGESHHAIGALFSDPELSNRPLLNTSVKASCVVYGVRRYVLSVPAGPKPDGGNRTDLKREEMNFHLSSCAAARLVVAYVATVRRVSVLTVVNTSVDVPEASRLYDMQRSVPAMHTYPCYSTRQSGVCSHSSTSDVTMQDFAS